MNTIRLFRSTTFASLLMLGLLFTAPAFAQKPPPPPPGGEPAAPSSGGSWDPVYGYVATAFLAAGMLFVVCKSARR